jgi:hypothetical protein
MVVGSAICASAHRERWRIIVVSRRNSAVAKSMNRGVAVAMWHYFPLHPLSSLSLQCSTADGICEAGSCETWDVCLIDCRYWTIRVCSFASSRTCDGGRQTSARRRWLQR